MGEGEITRIDAENAILEHRPDGSVAVKRRGKAAVIATTGDGETTVRVSERTVTILRPAPDEDPAPKPGPVLG